MSAAPAFDPADYAETDRAIFAIDGLWCPSCAGAVERMIATTPGVARAEVSFASASAAILWSEGTDLREIARRVTRLGYTLGPRRGHDDRDARIAAEQRRFAIRLAIAVVFGMWTMTLSILIYLGGSGLPERMLATGAGLAALPVMFGAGAPLIFSGWRTLRAGAPGMDTLVALGALAATIGSVASLGLGRNEVWFDTAVMLVILLLVARLIEIATLRRSGAAIAAVEDALPERAALETHDRVREVMASDVRPGAIIRIAPGERVPLDAEITQGQSRFDTASLTGESAPRPLGSGAAIEAGFINLDRSVSARVIAGVGARHVDRMGEAIAEMLHGRSEMDALATRTARLVAPLAIGLAGATLLAGFAFDLPGSESAIRALSVLIVACPCALALAAPLTHLRAASVAARAGIFLRRPQAAERFAAVRTIVLDKTGTLTEGRPGIRSVATSMDPQHLLDIAAAAEGDVRHPIADAIRAARETCLETRDSERSEDGVAAQVDGMRVCVGNRAFLSRHGVSVPEDATGIHVAIEGRHAGDIDIVDAMRPEAPALVASLQAHGYRVLVASGDTAARVVALGRDLGLAPETLHAGLTPEAKVALLRDLPGPVAFAGDGLNDAGAIAAADVGIAVSDASSASVAVADVVFSRRGLRPLLELDALSRRTARLLRQNLVFACAYNVGALAFAVAGAVPPLAAALAMAASSLCVVINAMRLRYTARWASGRISADRPVWAAPSPNAAS
ncbi:Cu+-exporting ATPase [Palleronia aestuarii]|uniref:Cu+-exporting ATPase n=1 Tax=Palleronia aestuarii TaxID=568105 RepID=A0A2W7PTM0_9RHOB|nr:cation-translocating P-type ATPase [Palleronia aestuarii]PZX12799.1 Cu+-exporting ATPase [Palleronia aestuarii]